MDSTLAVLDSFGLSEYEARTYAAVLGENPSEARKLSMRCGVPRTKIYSILRKLKERGLIFELPGEPSRFAPCSPTKAFGQYVLRKKEQVSDGVISLLKSQELLSSLEEQFKKTLSAVELKKNEVWIIHDQPEMLDKMKEMLSKAKRTVTLVAPEYGFVFFYERFGKLLDDLVEKRVSISVWTKVNSYNEQLIRELNCVCKVSNVDAISPFLYLCSDGKACLLIRLNQKNPDQRLARGFFSNNPVVCDLLSLVVLR